MRVIALAFGEIVWAKPYFAPAHPKTGAPLRKSFQRGTASRPALRTVNVKARTPIVSQTKVSGFTKVAVPSSVILPTL